VTVLADDHQIEPSGCPPHRGFFRTPRAPNKHAAHNLAFSSSPGLPTGTGLASGCLTHPYQLASVQLRRTSPLPPNLANPAPACRAMLVKDLLSRGLKSRSDSLGVAIDLRLSRRVVRCGGEEATQIGGRVNTFRELFRHFFRGPRKQAGSTASLFPWNRKDARAEDGSDADPGGGRAPEGAEIGEEIPAGRGKRGFQPRNGAKGRGI
jgi:hypothetical protein